MNAKLYRLMAILVVVSMLVAPLTVRPIQVAQAAENAAAAAAPITSPVSQKEISSDTGLYIVRLSDASLAVYAGGVEGLAPTNPRTTGARKLDVNTPASLAYQSYLDGKQNEALSTMEKALGHPVEVQFRYTNVLNALAVRLSPTEAAAIQNLPGIVAVYGDKLYEMDTDIGPTWIGAPSIWTGDTGSGMATQGEGIIVGMIDSGLNHAHPSFTNPAEDGYVYTNPYGTGVFHGVCDPSDPNYIAGFCNDKVISAFSFYPGVVSPEDLDGHGSHTASTAAGNTHEVTLTYGTQEITRTISGVAPHASLAIYKVCSPSCPGSASIAAVNQGIIDGVDVFNYSISGGDNPWGDPVDLAFLDAYNAGIFVSTSAGNSGPGPSTVAHTGPWNTATAMSTHTRLVANSLDVTDPITSTLQNLAALQGNGPALTTDLTREIAYDPTNLWGCTAYPAGYFTDKIAMVQRGNYPGGPTCSFALKVGNASAAGAVALVVYNNRGGPPSAMSIGGTIPSVMVGLDDGLALKALIDSHAPVTARLNANASVIINPAFADIIDSGSSRGPSAWELVKPDYAAPGVNILAAVAASGGDPVQYGFYGGTSMASPHGAGSAALMIALHPDWSPAEIKSAIATSAFPWEEMRNNTGASIIQADPLSTGAGRIALGQADKVGLVLDETYADYVAANPALGGKPRDLNQPGLVNYNCVGNCTWTRTVRSVLPIAATYTASFTTTVPLTVTVVPAVFTIPAGGTQVLTFTANTTALPLDVFAFGNVMLETDAVFPNVIMAEGFEGAAFPPAGWQLATTGALDDPGWLRDDGTSPDLDYGPITPYEGTYFAWHNDDPTTGTAISWLVSSEFTPTAGSVLSFFEDNYYTPLYYEYHGVWASTGSCNPADGAFVEVAEFPNNVNGWTEQTVDLSAYADEGICVAFRYTGNYADEWLIDNVVVRGAGSAIPVADQHLTTVVVPAAAVFPDQVNINTTQKIGSQAVTGLQVASEITDLTVGVDGLDQALMTTKAVFQDPTNGDPYDDLTNGVIFITTTVPAGALRLVAEVAASAAPDVDLFVGTGTVPSAATEVCVSATSVWAEYCNIDNPAAGVYWVVAQNWQGSANQPDKITVAVGVVTPGDAGNLTVTGPTTVPAGNVFDLALNWNEPNLVDGDRWYGVFSLGTDPGNPGNIGSVKVNLAYTQVVLINKDAPALAKQGEVIPYTIVLDGRGNPLNGLGLITDTLPTGVEFAGGLDSSFGTAWYSATANTVYWNNAPGAAAKAQAPAAQKGNRLVALSLSAVPANGKAASAPAAPDAAVSLVLDDGINESNIGIGGTWEFIYVNRFTPAPTEFPFALNQIQVYFSGGTTYVQPGDNITLVVYENTSGNTDPAVGSTFLAAFPTTVQAVDSWNVYDLATPVNLSGPGDVLVGVLAMQVPGSSYFPAALDTTATQQRSWAGWWLTTPPPTPPTLPPDDTWSLVDNFGPTFAGNWLVRGYGTSVDMPTLITVTFNVTVTGAVGSMITNTADLNYNGELFSAEATTEVQPFDVTFIYHDLEDVVQVGEDVAIVGSFNGWNANANVLAHDAGYTVFTGTLGLAGSYDYKYIVKSGGDQWDWLNTNNRNVVVSGDYTINDYRNVSVGYAHLIGPAAITIILGDPTGIISGEVYISNVTNPAGAGRGVMNQLGFGTGSDLSTWTWVDLTYVGQNGNNDVLTGSFIPAATGVYSYGWVRFDGNSAVGNPNIGWTYGDLEGVYPGNPFDLSQTGVLHVIYAPANADFTASPTSGIAPLQVVFTDTSTGDIDTWLWTFGDGVTSTLQGPTHIFTTPGVYTVTLTVSGLGGMDTETKTSYITVQSPRFDLFLPLISKGFTPPVGRVQAQTVGWKR